MALRCHQSPGRSHNFTFSLAAILPTPPCSAVSFEVNSEPHTGARPSVRLCVGLIILAGRVRARSKPQLLPSMSSALAASCLSAAAAPLKGAAKTERGR
jgi:hypothetical protein